MHTRGEGVARRARAASIILAASAVTAWNGGDTRSKPVRNVPVTLKDMTASFTVSPEYETVWYQVEVE